MPSAKNTISSTKLAETFPDGDQLRVELRGAWWSAGERPAWKEIIAAVGGEFHSVRLAVSDIEEWDTSLIWFLVECKRWCARHGVIYDDQALPESMRRLVAATPNVDPRKGVASEARRPNLFAGAGLFTVAAAKRGKKFSQFIGECVLSAGYLITHPRKFRWRDCFYEMQQCGVMSLPIVSLISFLVGVILAYIAAVILRQYGADIFVADLVGLTMVREMGAMMTGIILAGRTGGAFAAQIANMKAGEEIDALVTFGIRPVDFLVMPRLLALAVMMPLLACYANALGMLGGLAVSMSVLEISPSAYWIEMQTMVDLSDISTGLIKAATYGVIVGLAGCLRGLQADRDSAGVGRAATSAVVTAMLFIIVSDAVYAVVFNILGW